MFGLGAILCSVAKICVSVISCQVVSKAIQAIGRALGIIKEKDQIEDLGDRALQAEEKGITPDKYSTFNEYKQALDNFELNPDKTKATSLEEKEKKFIEICVLGMKEQNPNLKVEEMITLMDKNPSLFTPERANSLGRLVVEDPNVVNDIVGFISGNERNGKSLKNGRDALVKVEMEQNPNLTLDEARAIVYGKKQ